MMNVRDFVTDIETRHASEKFVLSACAEIERGNVPRNYRDAEKIAAYQKEINDKYQKECDKIREKSACLNAAPIGCIGLAADGNLLNFSTLNLSGDDLSILRDEGVDARMFEGEKEMMVGVTDFLDSCSSEYSRIVGFNSFKFDFSKMRLACRRNDVKLPEILKPENSQNQVDLMVDFIRKYNCEDAHRLMISLHAVCDELNIKYKKTLTGAEIPHAIARGNPGDHLTVVMDCTNDVIETYKTLLKIR